MRMRKRITILTALAVGSLLGWLAASGSLNHQFTPMRRRGRRAVGKLDCLADPARAVQGHHQPAGEGLEVRLPPAGAGARRARRTSCSSCSTTSGFGATQHVRRAVPHADVRRSSPKNGLRYNQFHTTALCSPTRGGADHRPQPPHRRTPACIMEAATGFPATTRSCRRTAATVAEVLKQNGYNTAWFGKNHNVPDWQTSQAGPFDLWPTGLGFEYFYGFIGGDTNQWRPAVIEGTKPIEPPTSASPITTSTTTWPTRPSSGSGCSRRSRRTSRASATTRPGATHAPHHPPKEWVAKYKGKFDQGWDKVREETLARQKKLGVDPAGREADAAAAGHAGLGHARSPSRRRSTPG